MLRHRPSRQGSGGSSHEGEQQSYLRAPRRTTAPSHDDVCDELRQRVRPTGRDPAARALVEPLGPVRAVGGASARRSWRRSPRLDPDVACLQEVWSAPDDAAWPALVAERLGFHHVHVVQRRRARAFGQRDRQPLADPADRRGVRSRRAASRTSGAPCCSPRSTARAARSRCSARTSTGGSTTATCARSRCGHRRVHRRVPAPRLPADPDRRHERSARQRRDPDAHRPHRLSRRRSSSSTTRGRSPATARA